MSSVTERLAQALAGRYRVERELGSGGMAVVFLAEDLKHGRRVALKVLRPELAEAIGPARFLQEIQIAARLTHPHILPLYDSGDAAGLLYYAMPYVEGESLRDRLDRERQLPLADALQIAREVAGALGHAHSVGVVHRDIKPENVLFAAGQAVVSDFGIARAIGMAGTDRLTATGMAVGTPAYMSPEQASADHVIDGRSDIYSLGCLLYEMLGGAPPFTGPTAQAVMARHTMDPVPRLRTLRPAVPEAVERAIERALAKTPADRFPTATQFADALNQATAAVPRSGVRWTRVAAGVALLAVAALGVRALTGGATPALASLAVLPFDDLSGDSAQAYFAAGMQEALISELSQIGALRVISRRSTMRYQGSDKPVPEIARELDVEGVVEATVQRDGDSVRIRVNLIRAQPEERSLWSQSYAGSLAGVTRMHTDVARAIAREADVAVPTDVEARLARPRTGTVNPATYDAYLRGMNLLNLYAPADLQRGLRYLHQATDQDPGDALAWAGLSYGYAVIGHGPAPPPDAWTRARAAAQRALALDSLLPEAHASLADIKLYYEGDWEGAEREFLRTNELNPNLAFNHYHYSWYLALMGRLDEAIAEHIRAQEVDPFTAHHTVYLGELYYWAGRYDDAMAEARRALEFSPDFPGGRLVLGHAYLGKGMFAEAVAAHESLAVDPAWRWALARTYALTGRPDDARRIAVALERQPATPWNAMGLAAIYSALRDNDRAFRWLNFEPRHAWTPWFRVSPWFSELRGDPRFDALLEKLKLPPFVSGR